MGEDAHTTNGHGATKPRRERTPRAPKVPITAEQVAKLRQMRAEGLAKDARFSAPITCILPQPKRVKLGGQLRTLQELRLIDVARLQGWIEEQVAHPLDGLPPWDDPARHEALAAVWEASREWPPKFGTPEGGRWLGTDAGIIQFVWICLQRCDPDVSLDEAEDCALALEDGEGTILRRIAYGTPPWREVASELFEPEPPGPPIDWAEAFDWCAERFGWPPDVVGNLMLSQWRAYRSGHADVYRGGRKPRQFTPPGRTVERPAPSPPSEAHPSGE